MNIVTPMAGKGRGFQQQYNLPKPLIEINGKTMIQHAVETCNLDGQHIFVINQDHKKWGVVEHLKSLVPDCKIVETHGSQTGQATAVLFAESYIDNDDYLFIQNCDHRMSWDGQYDADIDGWLMVQERTGPEWSFAKIDDDGWILETAEKKEISNLAQVGLFAWKHGKRYVQYCKEMVTLNLTVNNEFYVCPVYNQGISDGQRYRTLLCNDYWSFGSPDKVDQYLKGNNG
jgi:NDP-sugar pyrophosphorylase family protein